MLNFKSKVQQAYSLYIKENAKKKKKGGKGIKLYRVMLLINSRPQPDRSVNAVFFSTERQPG